MKTKIVTAVLLLMFCFTSSTLFGQVPDSVTKAALEKLKSTIFREDLYKLKGRELPAFQQTLLNGETLHSNSLKGRPTLINFWFSNCAPCIDKMPVLNEIKAQFDEAVNFIAITYQSEEEVNSFLGKYDFDFTQVVNARDFIKSVGIVTYPKTVLLDEELTVVEIVNRIPKASTTTEEIENQEEFRTRIVTNLNALLAN